MVVAYVIPDSAHAFFGIFGLLYCLYELGLVEIQRSAQTVMSFEPLKRS